MLHDSQLSFLIWMLTSTALTLLLQAGFICLEPGLFRAKTGMNVAIKNGVDFYFAAMNFWFFGLTLMFGANTCGLFGADRFFVHRRCGTVYRSQIKRHGI